jgi:DNA-binding winged helix-turn-helix (wHTH) protein
MTDHPARRVRFGVFEVDLRTGELRKRGAKVALQEQPFQVLALLLARAGDLVTREELRQRLWADSVFVDFDLGLNKAVAKLRTALGDSAESPRFIETLERRGYRFIADVVEVGHLDGQVPLPAHAALPVRAPRVIRLVGDGRVLPLAEGVHLLGRDPVAAVCIDSAVVSRRHASITVARDSLSIEDHTSRNGTFLNGRRIESQSAIVHGDEVRIGPARFVVSASPLESTVLEV